MLKGHTDTVDQLCWSPTDPDRLATASGDKTVRIWDARSKSYPHSVCLLLLRQHTDKGIATRCARIIPTDGENINICWSPDGKQIAVGNKVGRGLVQYDDNVDRCVVYIIYRTMW